MDVGVHYAVVGSIAVYRWFESDGRAKNDRAVGFLRAAVHQCIFIAPPRICPEFGLVEREACSCDGPGRIFGRFLEGKRLSATCLHFAD